MPHLGGVEKFSQSLAAELSKDSQVTVFCMNTEKQPDFIQEGIFFPVSHHGKDDFRFQNLPRFVQYTNISGRIRLILPLFNAAFIP